MHKKDRYVHEDMDIKVPFGNLLINVLYFSYLPPSPRYNNFEFHSHSSYELHFIPQGRGKLQVFADTYEVGPGTFYLTGPGVYHKQTADESDPMSEYGIYFEILGDKGGKAGKDLFLEEEIHEITGILSGTNFWYGRDTYGCIGLFERMIDEIEARELGYYESIKNYIGLIVINAARSYANGKKASYPTPKKTVDDRRRVIIEGFFRNYSENLTIEQLAREVGLSCKQLNRVIEQYYGKTFKEHLTQVRMDMAKILLGNTGLSQEEISQQIGFSSVSYFNRLFRETTGISPGKYRMSRKN